jgi:FkbM family methyltransferase
MSIIETLSALPSKYLDLLGKEEAIRLLKLFSDIEEGTYDKNALYEFRLRGFAQPVFLRAIRADMQSFINTFIDPYLEKKPYLPETDFVIDAGANIGYTAILFATWWPNAQIISIEPDKENYELTLRNTAQYPNIKVLQGAVWNKAARLRIEAGQEDGFVVKEITGEEQGIKTENLTTGISIHDLMKAYGKTEIGFLKLNVEGSEKEIFSEAYAAWLPKTKALLVELHDGKNPGCSRALFNATSHYSLAVAETASYGILFVEEGLYVPWYAKWYKEDIYEPRINKARFPKFYLDKK